MPFENWTLCEWDGLHEGYNKCTLPLLPDVPALTRVPLEVDHITEATSPRTLEPTFRAVSEYNSHLGYVGQLDEGKRAALSQSVVRRVTEMRRISEQARKEMSAQVDALTGAVRDFVDYVKHGELDFENPAWATLGLGVLCAHVSAMKITDPRRLVQAIFTSLPEAAILHKQQMNRNLGSIHRSKVIVDDILVIADKLDTLPNGQYHAFDLCFTIKTEALLGAGPRTWQSMQRIDSRIFALLPGNKGPRPSRSPNRVTDLNFAERSRILWQSMQRLGCTLDFERSKQHAMADCGCQRWQNFHLLDLLWQGAHRQIRCKILLTLARLLPREICDLLFEMALAAEDVPSDPHVAKSGAGIGRLLRVGDWQRKIKPQYRCPRLLVGRVVKRCLSLRAHKTDKERGQKGQPLTHCRQGAS